jgi:hypothetical protein
MSSSSELLAIFVCQPAIPNLEKYGHYKLQLMYAVERGLAVTIRVLLPTNKTHCKTLTL